jgi:putative DNA primase/helicase
MRHIDVIRDVKLKANGQWQNILSNLGAEVPLNQHTACPHCGGKDRFRFDNKDGNGTFICNQCGSGDGLDLVQRVLGVSVTEAAKEVAGMIGIDTRSNIPPAYRSHEVKAQQGALRAQQAEKQANEQIEKHKRFIERYNRTISNVQRGESDYLKAKGLYGFEMDLLQDGSLIIPLVDGRGKITGAQTIKPNGEKRLLADSIKSGSYYQFNEPVAVTTVIIAEGLATAITCHLIQPEALAVAAIDAGNLIHVAKAMRTKYPESKIIIAGDNDIKPEQSNTGKLAAEKAAKVANGIAVLPPTDDKADWDDYRLSHGIEAIRLVFNAEVDKQGSKVMIEIDVNHKAIKSDPMKTRIESRDDGVFLVIPKADKETGEIIHHEQWLSNQIKRITKGVNDLDQEYLIIKWGKSNIQAIPMGDIGEREGWRSLKNAGLLVTTKSGLRQSLSDWLLRQNFKENWSITAKSGWHKGAYIMPDGSVIGVPEQPILFNGQSAAVTAYKTSGTLDSWRNEVARLANKNSFMMFAIGAALAAPMTSITQADSFGIHLYAQSTAGKSTTADMAVSLYGDPDLQRLTWYGTEYGMTNEAVAHNDGLLYLDEVGQGADPKHVYKSAYTLFNGKGKIQGAKEGGNRQVQSWRTVAISTGEKDIETFLLNSGVKVNAGQLVRLLNIPIERATELHECETGKEHADLIKVNCRANYGTAGRYWIEYLSNHKEEAKEAYRAAQQRWGKLIPSSYGEQVHRASDRFSAIESALLMGRVITGWDEQDCRDAVQAVFNVWLAEFGTGNKEIEQITEQALAFLNTYGISRYAPLPYDERDLPIRDLAGYRERKGSHDDAPILFYTLPNVFRAEVAKGFNAETFAEVLATMGILKKPAKGKRLQGKTPRLKHLGGTQQRAYIMMLVQDDDDD